MYVLNHCFDTNWHAGNKSVHLVAHNPNSSAEQRHPFLGKVTGFAKHYIFHLLNTIGIFGTK